MVVKKVISAKQTNIKELIKKPLLALPAHASFAKQFTRKTSAWIKLIYVFYCILAVIIFASAYILVSSKQKVVVAPAPTPTPFPTPTQSPILNWQTYSNQYSLIRYPQDVKAYVYSKEQFEKATNQNTEDIFKYYKGEGYGSPRILSAAQLDAEKFEISIWIFDNRGQLSIDQWFNTYDYYPVVVSMNSEEAPSKEIQVGQQIGLIGYPKTNIYTEIIFLPGKNKIALIFTTFNQLEEEERKVTDQIIQTFTLR